MDQKIKAHIKAHGWHDVEITGGALITGDTYRCQDFIRNVLGGQWSAADKGWIVNPETLRKYTSASGNIMRV